MEAAARRVRALAVPSKYLSLGGCQRESGRWQRRVGSCATCSINWLNKIEVIPVFVGGGLGIPVAAGVREIPRHEDEVVGCRGYFLGV